MTTVTDWPGGLHNSYVRAKFGGPLMSMIQVTKRETVSHSEATATGFDIGGAIRRIKGLVFDAKSMKLKELELFGGVLSEADIDHGDSYKNIVLYGKYAIVTHFYTHAFWGPPTTSGLPDNLEPTREGPYEPSRQYWLFEKGNDGVYELKDKQFDTVESSPFGDETLWSSFTASNRRNSAGTSRSGSSRKVTNHFSSDGKTITSYIVLSDTYYYWRDDSPSEIGYSPNIKGEFHSLRPYIVRRDLSQGLLPVEVVQQLPFFAQDFSGTEEYWSPNHVYDRTLYDFWGVDGFLGYEGLIAMDQDSVHMTTQKRTRTSGVEPTNDLFVEVNLISIDIETGSKTVHKSWSFNHELVTKAGAKTIFELMHTRQTGNTYALGYVEGNFGSNELKFYAGPKSNGLGAVAHKFSFTTPHDIFRGAGETGEGNYREGFFVEFWSANNASSWEDESGAFKDKQIYCFVVGSHDVADGNDPDPVGTISVYKSEGGADPELVKEYTQHIGFGSRGSDIKVDGKRLIIRLGGLDDQSHVDAIPPIWKSINVMTGEEKDIEDGLNESFQAINDKREEDGKEPLEPLTILPKTTTFEL